MNVWEGGEREYPVQLAESTTVVVVVVAASSSS